jgi:hypothetical protein
MAGLLMNALAQGLLNSIDIPTLLMIALAGMFGWKLFKGASKTMAAVVLLVLIGGFAASRMWPKQPPEPIVWTDPIEDTEQVEDTGQAQPEPEHPALSSRARPKREAQKEPRKGGELPEYVSEAWPRPREGVPPQPPTYPEIHARGIRGLAKARAAKVAKDPMYLNRARRDGVIATALAKNEERKRREELLAQQEQTRGFASVPPSPPRPGMMTPDQARGWGMDLADGRIAQAQALSARIAQKYGPAPTMYAGAGQGRRDW